MTEAPYFSFLIHAQFGRGKSRLADASPGPRLLLDAEGGAADWTPSPKIFWTPDQPWPTQFSAGDAAVLRGQRQAGDPIDSDTTIVVLVQNWDVVVQTFKRLNSGDHYIETVVWDSVTEIQQECKRKLEAGGNMDQQRWGALLDQMVSGFKDFRNLKVHPIKKVNSIFIANSTAEKTDIWHGDVQGALARKLPSYVDLVGYLFTEMGADGKIKRRLAIQPVGPFDAKDRTDILTQRFGYIIDNPDMRTILAVLKGEA